MLYWNHQVTPYKKFPVLGNANFAKSSKTVVALWSQEYLSLSSWFRLLFEEGIASLCSLAEMSIIAITLRRPTAAGAASGFVSEKQKEF